MNGSPLLRSERWQRRIDTFLDILPYLLAVGVGVAIGMALGAMLNFTALKISETTDEYKAVYDYSAYAHRGEAVRRIHYGHRM